MRPVADVPAGVQIYRRTAITEAAFISPTVPLPLGPLSLARHNARLFTQSWLAAMSCLPPTSMRGYNYLTGETARS